jgi:hypothetical protein
MRLHAAVAITLALALAGPASAVSIAELSNQDAVKGLKEALVLSADKAVSQLGSMNGFPIPCARPKG